MADALARARRGGRARRGRVGPRDADRAAARGRARAVRGAVRRARRDVDRRGAAARRRWPRRARSTARCCSSTASRRWPGIRCDLDEAGVDAAFSRLAEVPELPARASRRSPPTTARCERVAGLAARGTSTCTRCSDYWHGRRRPRLPPHRADEHGRRAARGAARSCRRRGSSRAGRATPRPTRRCAARSAQLGLRAHRARRRAAAPAAGRARCPRASTRRAVRGALLHEHGIEVAGGARAVRRAGVADRRHGRGRAAGSRRSASCARSRASCRSTRPSRWTRCRWLGA